MNLQRILSLFCSGAMALHLMAAGPESGANTAASPTLPTGQALSVKDIEELRHKIAEQQKTIEELKKSISEQQALLDTTMRAVAAGAAAVGVSNNNSGANVSTAANNPPALVPVRNEGGGKGQGQGGERRQSPLSFTIGTADFTPFGFVDATYVGRSTNVGSSIATNFAGIPYNNSAQGRIGENTFSTQNSRIGVRVDSTVLGAKVLGYFEADFLGNQPANIFVTSNADTFRMRNVFADIQKGKFEVMGGQDWSLLTPGRKGLSPIPADLFFTQNMDTNYQVGLTWSRQTQFRFAYHPSEKLHFALSLEDPQQYVGGSSGAPTITYPSAIASNAQITGQFNNGQSNYSVPNSSPDFIAKAAYDAKIGGLSQHIEIVGLLRHFKYYNNTFNSNLGKTFGATGGGGSVNGNFEVFKNVHLIANTFFSDGGGRYVFGMAPDLIVRPNGDISPVHTYSTVDGFEANLTKNLALYTYYGGTYIGKNVSLDATPQQGQVGYGVNTQTTGAQNRSIQEFTIGLTPTFFRSPQYGALQLITQYSYLWRTPWHVAPGNPKDAKTNMVYVNLRYTLP